jgi:hypothetical protein
VLPKERHEGDLAVGFSAALTDAKFAEIDMTAALSDLLSTKDAAELVRNVGVIRFLAIFVPVLIRFADSIADARATGCHAQRCRHEELPGASD